ncbi:hypothetical protein Lalb_Chr12g0205801 [Lupinus albus]|uniref:Uncharacterized protein n=1 Tax=Lupinus albus TaxID=3870 RepID=A0A6A4PN95_LUPAL|nr:hypothetical protein Lalb_Chr12g0205801 [Lupinus albus]
MVSRLLSAANKMNPVHACGGPDRRELLFSLRFFERGFESLTPNPLFPRSPAMAARISAAMAYSSLLPRFEG